MTDQNKEPTVVAAVEAGGTSFVVAICHVYFDPPATSATTSSSSIVRLPTIIARHEVDSSHSNPAQTLEECCIFLQVHKPSQGYAALGIASFGPLGVNPSNIDTYGTILKTSPKAQWRGVDLLTPLKAACQGHGPDSHELKVRVETDVNAPAMAEHLLLSQSDDADESSDISSLAYVTVGTGIGVGLVVNSRPVHGRMHPEGGHVPVHPLEGDAFGGYSWGANCPFRGVNTVEGLASSVALTERYHKLVDEGEQKRKGAYDLPTLGKPRSILADLPDDHEVWDHAANALANLCTTLLLTLSVEKIVLGGGLMKRYGLLEKIQRRTVELINGYLDLPDKENMDELITTSRFGSDAGLMGTVVLAQMALTDEGEDGPAERNSQDIEEKVKAMKQTAFTTGLWSGVLLGALGTAMICSKYFFSGRRR